MSSQDNNETSSSQYFCRKCKCHGMYFPVKGHKPYCEYKNCECSNCSRVPRRSRKSFTVPPAVESEEDDVVVVGEVRNKSNGGQEVKQETTDTKPIPANPAESNKYSSLTNENLVTTSTVSSAKSPVTKRQPVRRQNTPAATSSEERQKILQQLKELHELKKCEALNAEEFEEKKRILLNDFR